MRAWLYYRLSRDEDQEMNSLHNQRQILVDYAEQHGYEIVGESFDDNVTGIISDTHLRMLVNQVQIHQNKDKSLDIKFRMNGNWSGGVAVYVEPESEEIVCS